jgi:hypothetical protein
LRAVGHTISQRSDAVEIALRTAVQPNPLLGFLLQMATAGAFAGTLVAYRRRRQDPEFDPFPIVTRWSAAILGIGVGWVLFEAIA